MVLIRFLETMAWKCSPDPLHNVDSHPGLCLRDCLLFDLLTRAETPFAFPGILNPTPSWDPPGSQPHRLSWVAGNFATSETLKSLHKQAN